MGFGIGETPKIYTTTPDVKIGQKPAVADGEQVIKAKGKEVAANDVYVGTTSQGTAAFAATPTPQVNNESAATVIGGADIDLSPENVVTGVAANLTASLKSDVAEVRAS